MGNLYGKEYYVPRGHHSLLVANPDLTRALHHKVELLDAVMGVYLVVCPRLQSDPREVYEGLHRLRLLCVDGFVVLPPALVEAALSMVFNEGVLL